MNIVRKHITLQQIRSFYITGEMRHVANAGIVQGPPFQGSTETTINLDGFYAIGQMYVQHFSLTDPQHDLPIIFMHGGGMTGSVWGTTPADQPGWHDYFMRTGFNSYICDAVERGRASSPPLFLVKTEPIYRTIDQAWENFRFGPQNGYCGCWQSAQVFPGCKFPVNQINNFACQLVGRWIDTELDTYAQIAYNKLINKTGDCILLAHSQGAGFALQAALSNYPLVRKVIAIEPSFCPDLPVNHRLNASTDYLFLWGDNLYASEYWRQTRKKVDKYCQKLTDTGASVCICDLPNIGIKGNSHMMMMDNNNAEIANYILNWILSRHS